jgi:hypothetical protein
MPMTDAEFYDKMFAVGHKGGCNWSWDQYWWECDCGLIPVEELKAERDQRQLPHYGRSR